MHKSSKSQEPYYFDFSRWHGCTKCYTGAARDLKIGGRTIEELYESTMRRIDDLELKYNHEVHIKWECEFKEELRRDLDLKKQFDDIYVPPHLDHRIHSLRGGRTEPFEFEHTCKDAEQILLLDIVRFIKNLEAFA